VKGRRRNALLGRPLKLGTIQSYRIPRDRQGRPVPWVLELARLRAAGHTSVAWLAGRLLMGVARIYQVMRAPDYPELELLEGLAMLERRRPRALVALADRADQGDPAAVRLLLEITGVLEPVRPVLVTLKGLVRDAGVAAGGLPGPAPSDDPRDLAAQRDQLFRSILGQEPVDVVFRQLEAPAPMNNSANNSPPAPGHNGHNGNGHNGNHKPGGENGTSE